MTDTLPDVPALVHLAAPVDHAAYTLRDGRVYIYDATAAQSGTDEFPTLPTPGGAHGGTSIRWAGPKPPDPKNPPLGVFFLVHEPGVLSPEWYSDTADLVESNAVQTHAVLAHILGLLGERTLRLLARTYQLSAGLFYNGTGRIEGASTNLNDQTRLLLMAPAGYVIKMQGQGNGLQNLTVDAHRLAPYAIQEASAPYAERRGVKVTGATRDGVRLLRYQEGPNLLPPPPTVPPTPNPYHATNNDGQQWDRCAFWYNGTAMISKSPLVDELIPSFTRTLGLLDVQRRYVGGTASVTAESSDIVGTGKNWTTLDIQPGDAIWIQGEGGPETDFVGEVSVVLSNTVIRMRNSHVPLPGGSMSGRPFAIMQGCGWRDERHSDNNICQLIFPFARGNAHAGVYVEGLYGHALINGQYDDNGVYGIQVGGRRNDPLPRYQDPVYSTEITKPYFEGNGYCALGLFYARSFTVSTPLWAPNEGVGPYLTGGPDECYGVILSDDQAPGGFRAVTAIGQRVP